MSIRKSLVLGAALLAAPLPVLAQTGTAAATVPAAFTLPPLP